MNARARTTASVRARPGRRARRRAETARRILDTAMRLFTRHGYANTTVEAITEAADIGKGTFFNYFPGKEHLIVAFGEQQVEKVVAAAKTMEGSASIRGLIQGTAESIASGWKGNQRLVRTMFGALLAHEALSKRFAQLLAKGRRNMVLVFEEGQRRGEIRADLPAVMLASMLQQAMLGAQLVWSLDPGFDLIKWIDQSLDLLWAGVGAPAPRETGRRRRGAK